MVLVQLLVSKFLLLAVGCLAIVCGMISYRVSRVLSSMVIAQVVRQDEKNLSKLQVFARRGLIGRILGLVSIVFTAVFRLIIQIFRTVFGTMYMLLPVIILSICLALIQTRWGGTLHTIDSWGSAGTLGVLSFLRTLVIVPLAFIAQLSLFVSPLYNIVVYVLVHLPLDILLWSVTGGGGNSFLFGDGLLNLLYAIRELVLAFVKFLAVNSIDCSSTVAALQQQCVLGATGVLCTGGSANVPLYASVAFTCLDPSQRYLNLSATNALAQKGAVELVQAVGAVDGTFGMVLSGLLYPLNDADSWVALEAFMNAFLGFGIVAPTQAMARCSLAQEMHQSTSTRLSMCMLDIGFAFDYMVYGLRTLSGVLNRWLNMAYVLLVYGKDIPCPESMDLSSVFDDPIWKAMVGNNQTALVKLSDTQFAITDGSSVMYVTHATQITRQYAAVAWGVSVDPSFGIAAVSMPPGSVDSIGMMGCTCSDTPDFLIACTILGKSGASFVSIPVFEVDSSRQFLTCARSRIIVQSIRWPDQVAGMGGQSASCVKSGTCLAADVAVYVIPICGGLHENVLACFPDASFALSNCFPYCMGLHLVGGSQYQSIVLRGASTWSSGVLLSQRSCMSPSTYMNMTAGKNDITVCTDVAGVPQLMATQNTDTGEYQCPYSSVCFSFIVNRTNIGYSAPNAIAPVSTSNTNIPTADGIRILLAGQPLVVAGGVTMRLFQDSQNSQPVTYSVDFPHMVGNQYNEFTMEVGRGDGIACAPPAPVPSMLLSSAVAGAISVPPLDVDRKKWYNPATLTPGGLMWYAVNPNYEWASQFFMDCANTIPTTQLQLAIISNYAPISVWNVHYQLADLCIVQYDSHGVPHRTCTPNVAQGIALNPSKGIRFLSNTQGFLDPRMCTDGSTFDLWVESIEHFDNLNVAVSVRRGSILAITNLYFGIDTGNVSDCGITVTYFINTQHKDMSMIREGSPWLLPTQYPSVIIGTTQLCPAFQFLPDIGTFVMESLSSAVLLFKMPIVLLFNPFAIAEMLASRGSSCVDNTLSNSLLRDCGAPMFSLTDFYAAVETANTAFWSIWSFLVYIVSGSTGTFGAYVAPMVQGGVVYLESSHTTSLMPVVYVADSFNVAAIDQIIGGRRRLLQAAAAAKVVGKKVGMGLLNGLITVLEDALYLIAQLPGLVSNIAMAQVSKGADFGILIAARDPTHMLGEWCTAPVMAWSHFTYKFVMSVVLDIAAGWYQGKPIQWTVISLRFYDSKSDFNSLVVPATQAQCSALRLIFGAGRGLGETIYYNCLSAIAMGSSLFDMLRVFVVEVPLFRCTCIGSNGQDFLVAQQACQMYVPPSLKHSYQSMIASVEMGKINSAGVCTQYADALKTNALTIFDEWYSTSELSANAIGSFLQDLFVPSGGTMQCSLGPNNPWAVVLMPVPNDHFYICGKTTGCQTRCATELATFQTRLNYVTGTQQSTSVYPVSVESPLFNPYASVTAPGSLRSGQLLALTRPGASGLCAGCGTGADCVVALTAPWQFDPSNWNSVIVAGYCVPPAAQINSFVFAAPVSPVSILQPADLASLQDSTTSTSTVTFWDFARQPTYVMIGVSLKQETIIEVLYAANCMHGGIPHVMLHTNQLIPAILSPSMLKYLFPGPELAAFWGSNSGISIKDCSIVTVVEVATQVPGMLAIFLEVQFSLSFPEGVSRPPDTPPTTTHAIKVWCDPAMVVADPRKRCNSIEFFTPCYLSLSVSMTQRTEDPSCKYGLSLALHLGNTGVLAYKGGNFSYLHIPGSDALEVGKPVQIRAWDIHPDGSNTTLLDIKQKCTLQRSSVNKAILGTWTYSQAFATELASIRLVKSTLLTSVATDTTSEIWRLYQGTQNSAGSVQWLSELRVQIRPVCSLQMLSSTVAHSTAKMSANCTPLSCTGCTDPQTKVLCADTQNCIIARCIGSPAEMNSVLCAVGGLVSNGYHQMAASWLAIYQFIIEIGMLVAQGAQAGEQSLPQSVMIRFPTDQFYDMVCKYKDLSAGITGLCVSLINSISQWANSGYATIQISSQVSASQAQSMAQTKSLANFMYNLLMSTTLFPILAVHRWLMCLFGGSAISGGTMGAYQMSVQLGDVTMDTSWGTCSPSGCLSTGLFGGSGQQCITDSVKSFADFILALNSGIGETLLYLMILGWNSAIDIGMSAVWGIQGILYAYNLKDCKVTDYTQMQALTCACGDSAAVIPASRADALVPSGHFWCVGSLDIVLTDGTPAIIYNPYSMTHLNSAVSPILKCLTSMTAFYDACISITVANLDILYHQNAHPMAVWSKCKSNYMLKSWDTAAGALFIANPATATPELIAIQTQAQQPQAWLEQCHVDWMQQCHADMLRQQCHPETGQLMCAAELGCLQDTSRLHRGYSECASMRCQRSSYKSTEAYFQYQPQTTPGAVPDACIAFSGFATSKSVTSELRSMAQNCLLDPTALDITATSSTSSGTADACELQPGMWTSTMPLKLPVTVQHGQINVANTNGNNYGNIQRVMINIFDQFYTAFLEDSGFMKEAIYSKDGDILHDALDCVFLGPYAESHYLPCDLEGAMECPTYWRSDDGTRNFSACTVDSFFNDLSLPYTCGSQLRRSFIKYFYRNFSQALSGKGLQNITEHILLAQVNQTRVDWTNVDNYGCLNKATGKCTTDACDLSNFYEPCLNMDDFTVSGQNIMILTDAWMKEVEVYYQHAMQDTHAWTTYYAASAAPGEPSMPAQWNKDTLSAMTADAEMLYQPSEPVLEHSIREVYSMPTHPDATETERLAGSAWALCMAVIAQPWSTLPIDLDTSMPEGWEALQGVDWTDLGAVKEVVEKLVSAAALKSPLYWHKARRHAPSPSAVCTHTTSQSYANAATMNVGGVVMTLPDPSGKKRKTVTTTFEESMPHRGFGWGQIGGQTCLCSEEDPAQSDLCRMNKATVCSQLLQGHSMCRDLVSACASNTSYSYSKKTDTAKVFSCLQQAGAGVQCPELAPSDVWGLFPVDCGDETCDSANMWAAGKSNVLFPGWRFLMEGRSGLWLSNYQHVNRSYNQAVHYAAAHHAASDYQQTFCPASEDTASSDVIDDIVSTLFPAVQILVESPVVAACTRFVIETARATALSAISASASMDSINQANSWRRKCGARMRHLTLCHNQGIYFNVNPPSPTNALQKILQTRCGDIAMLSIQDTMPDRNGEAAYYITPWCTIVNRVNQTFYDGRRCASLFRRANNGMRFSMGVTTLEQLSQLDCALKPQPQTLLTGGNVPAHGSTRFPHDVPLLQQPLLYEADLSVDSMTLASIQQLSQGGVDAQSIDSVLDWWPDSVPMPTGYHVTAPMIPEQLAPVVFDSHYAFDPTAGKLLYTHSALRNASLLHRALGAGGLCRAHSVGMPLFDSNTNRFCTRSPKEGWGAPHLPIDSPSHLSTLDPKLLDSLFEEQQCAPDATSVPWLVDLVADPLSGVVGGIPRLRSLFDIDSMGDITYADSNAAVYPPANARSSLTNMFPESWGSTCDPLWSATPPCSVSGKDCPTGTQCLPLGGWNRSLDGSIVLDNNNTANGICFSAYNNGNRLSCFRSDHCFDGDVCLADGGCSPLNFHMWNPESNEDDIEFSVLADSCGVAEGLDMPPYTQNLRGASPWEQVPDVLTAHGMCSHHDWVSYRNALNSHLCSVDDESELDHAVLAVCDAAKTRWPWVFMDFERTLMVDSATFNMSQKNFLQVRAHSCDLPYLHSALATGGKGRLQVCTGYLGIELGDYYADYGLDNMGTWVGQTIEYTQSLEAAHWMRTTDAMDPNQVHVAAFHHASQGDFDVRLGFLGGTTMDAVADPILQAMGRPPGVPGVGVTFTRCIDNIECTMPAYTVAGSRYTRLNVMEISAAAIAKGSNFSEASLRRCGSTGILVTYTQDAASHYVCRLDHTLFPLFMYLLVNLESEVAGGLRGCSALWPAANYLSSVMYVSDIETIEDPASDRELSTRMATAARGTLFCYPAADVGCLYAARESSTLTDAQTSDSVATIAVTLNKIAMDASAQVLSRYHTVGFLTTYEDIALCGSSIADFKDQTQVTIAEVYAPLAPQLPGLYMAFWLSLYEYPPQWLFHAMQSTLLSQMPTASDVGVVQTSMMRGGAVSNLLWDSSGDLCQDSRLQDKPSLYSLVCKHIQPAYTTLRETVAVTASMHTTITNNVKDMMTTEIFGIQEGVDAEVKCFSQVQWNCFNMLAGHERDACTKALLKSYNTTSCDDKTFASEFPVCDTSSKWFIFQAQKNYPISELPGGSVYGTFLLNLHAYVLTAADRALKVLDYISGAWSDLATAADQGGWVLPIARTQEIVVDTYTQNAAQQLDEWLTNTCVDDIGAHTGSVCVSREDMLASQAAGMQCLYPSTVQTMDQKRYLYDPKRRPEVVIVDAGQTVTLKVCGETCLFNAGHTIGCMNFNSDSPISTYTTTSIAGATIDCGITSVVAPPGVQVRAYAALPAKKNTPPMIPCTWANPVVSDGLEADKTQWWPLPLPLHDPYDSFSQDFTQLVSLPEGLDIAFENNWRSNGCGKFTSVCKLEFRMELTTTTKGVCSGINYVPVCDVPTRAFQVTTTDPLPDVTTTIYRCDACTPIVNSVLSDTLVPPWTPYIGCSFKNYKSATSLSTSTLDDALGFILNELPLSGAFPLDMDSGFRSYKVIEKTQAIYNNTRGVSISDTLIPWNLNGYWEGFLRYDPTSVLQTEQSIWAYAVQHSSLQVTMVCQDSFVMEPKCTGALDQRRQALGRFVQAQYRETDGVWLQKVSPGQGVMWKSNAAHSKTGRFTVMFASSGRSRYGDGKEVLVDWLMSSAPCSDLSANNINSRICVQSQAGGALYAVHPWVGGDYNPFVGSENGGLDVCPWIGSSTTMCPCKCQPVLSCQLSASDNTTNEFPTDNACRVQQSGNVVPLFITEDNSDLCSMARSLSSRPQSQSKCTFRQGLLGGVQDPSTHTLDELNDFLHSESGKVYLDPPTTALYYEEELLSGNAVLWGGGTLSDTSWQNTYGFLRMPRSALHPAHVAFGFDQKVSNGGTLIVKGLRLLEDPKFAAETTDTSWVGTLQAHWDIDNEWIQRMYPQLVSNFTKASDWSCPIRVASFLGGTDPQFSPLTPNPISSATMYGLGGAHPFIKSRSLSADVMQYNTTNGYCFYPVDQAGIKWSVSGVDSSPCSLLGSIRVLQSHQWALSSVEEDFDTRCMDIMDAPQTQAQLRNDENMSIPSTPSKRCGILGRIRPFLARVSGDMGKVTAIPNMTTSSEGGDCHMGRAILLTSPSTDLRGKNCALVSKNSSHAIASCDGDTVVVLQRSQPLSLARLLDNIGTGVYRDEAQPWPVFYGASGAETDKEVQEVSFGQLYSASLAETLASDLISQCSAANGDCTLAPAPWGTFVSAYASGTLANGGPNNAPPDPALLATSISARQDSQLQRLQQDKAAWGVNWTWSFQNLSVPSVQGGFSKADWLLDRGKTCVASLRSLLSKSPIQRGVSNISLCNPPPTHSLAILCSSLGMQREQLVARNCQLKGKCVGSRTMFYLPYQWMHTNNEYAGSTVTQYYQYITTKLYPIATPFAKMCPSSSPSSLLNLSAISIQVASHCPASPLNNLKIMLNNIRTIGDDCLQMAYDLGMMVLSIIAMPFSMNDPATFATLSQLMGSYFESFINIFVVDLLPLLEQVVYMILQTSNVGRGIATFLQGMCIFINGVINVTMRVVWCPLVKPALVGILSIIQSLASLAGDSNTANNIQSINDALRLYEDIPTCQSHFNDMRCNFFDQTVPTNSSLFLPQATPTICWSNDIGGGTLAGQASLLTCTASDTCALQPLSANAQLVYCGSCPAIIDIAAGIEGSGYACNVYLRQCSCGVVSLPPQPCLHTSECVQPSSAQCSISDSTSTLSNSFITLQCSSCSSVNKQPVCMIDNQGAATGYCSCANVQQSLLPCSAAPGTKVYISPSKQANAMCLVALDSNMAASLYNIATNAAAYTLLFSQLVVGPCILGIYNNLCMNVQTPYTVSQASSISSLVVLYSSTFSSGGGRRLLSFVGPDVDDNTHDYLLSTASDGDDRARGTLLIMAAQTVAQTQNWSLSTSFCNTTMSLLAETPTDEQIRHDAKSCIQWHALMSFAMQSRGLSSFPDLYPSLESFKVHAQRDGTMGFASQVLMNPGWIWDILRENHYTRFSTVIPHTLYKMASGFHTTIGHQPKQEHTQEQQKQQHQRRLLQLEVQSQVITGVNFTYAVQWDIVIHNPFNTLVSLASVTGEYYQEQLYLSPPATCNDTGWASCANFKFPNITATTLATTPILLRLADLILVIPTMGIGGSKILEALISDLPYNTSVEQDYITGSRIVHELSFCNYTALTLGPTHSRNILAVCIVSVLVIYFLSIFCCPSPLAMPLLLSTLFPVMVLWGTYTLSPLCFPMLPPTLFRDIYVEVERYFPASVLLPNTFVKKGCLSNGTLISDALYHDDCFIRCTDPPFLMTSWQDTTAWWLCELDTQMCRAVADWVRILPFMRDFISSAYYYADVIRFGAVDDQFTAAHRVCAVFTMYNIGLLVIMIALALMLLPYVTITLVEIVTAISIFLVEAQAVDAVDA